MAGANTDLDLTTAPAPRRASFEITALSIILGLVLALLAGSAAALYQRSRPALYRSSAVLLIDQPAVVSQTDNDGPLAKLQRLRYQYADLLTTSVIANPVSRQVDLPAALVQNSVIPVVQPTTFTIGVVAQTRVRSQASLIAQAAASELSTYISKQQAHTGIAPVARVVLNEVSTPRTGVQVAPKTQTVLVTGAIAFVVVAVGFVVVADQLRRRR